MKTHDITEQTCRLGFVYRAEIELPDGSIIHLGDHPNLIPQAGIDQLASLIMGTGSPVSTYYVGVFASNFVPTSATKASDLQTSAGESLAYSQAARPLWNKNYDGVNLISSNANRAEFTFTADTVLYGGFLCSDSAKGGNSGVLLSIARFATPYTVPAGSTFRLGVAISLVS